MWTYSWIRFKKKLRKDVKKAFIKTEEIEEDERLQKQCEDNERKNKRIFCKT